MARTQFTALATGVGMGLIYLSGPAFADSIDPTTFSADLDVGESVTIEKTVVVEAAGVSDAVIDIHFLFDTSGSMGSEINAAKAAAEDLFVELSDFGDVAASVGVYSEAARLTGTVPGLVINQDLTTDTTTAKAALNDVTRSVPDGGGDGPENGVTGVELSTENLSWRTGSTRFMFAFGDFGFKTSDNTELGPGLSFDTADNVDGAPISTVAGAIAALDEVGVSLFGLSYGSSFTSAIEALGGEAFASTLDPEDIIDDITGGISAGFADYEAVTVGDLGGGLPGIAVSAVCTGADIGTCVGSDAEGDYDRSVDRTFTFDVTFERVADGFSVFNTYALVDGGIVASERDTFGGSGTTGVIPLPASVWLMLAGLGGLGAMRRRKSKG